MILTLSASRNRSILRQSSTKVLYRSDIEYDFDLKPSTFQKLIDNIDRDLAFANEVEAGVDRCDIVNYEIFRMKIVEQLELLRDRPKRKEKPYVYHLDVGAMNPFDESPS